MDEMTVVDGLNTLKASRQDAKKLLQRLDIYSQPWSNIQSQRLGYLFFIKSLTDSKKNVNFNELLLVLTVWITSRVKMRRNCFKGWINIRRHDQTFNPSHLVIYFSSCHYYIWFYEECKFYWSSVGFDGLNYFTGQDEKKLLQRLDKYSHLWSNIESQPLGYLFFVKSLTDSKKYVNFIEFLLVWRFELLHGSRCEEIASKAG